MNMFFSETQLWWEFLPANRQKDWNLSQIISHNFPNLLRGLEKVENITILKNVPIGSIQFGETGLFVLDVTHQLVGHIPLQTETHQL